MKVLVLPDRFWDKVTKHPGGCWEWQGSRDAFGYGMFRLDRTRVRRTHRLAFEALVGPIPDGLILLHACDNPPCVNPEHLSPGTHVDNMRDRDQKGRHVSLSGTDHGRAKLTPEAVAEIRSAEPKGLRELAKKHGVALGTVYGLRCRSSRTWRSVA